MYFQWHDPRLPRTDPVASPAADHDDAVSDEEAAAYPSLATFFFVLAHVPLAWVMHYASFVTAVHAFAVVGVGLWRAASDDEPLLAAAYSVAYIAGAEVLWRMTNDRLFWELAKYSVIAICLIALVRSKGLQALTWPVLAFAVLMPSALLTITQLPLAEVRNQLSFNLSGPLALIVCSAFFASVRLSAAQFQRLSLYVVAPSAGIAAIALLVIVTNPDITFSHQSNFALSGGFGPNQVSAALGLGVTMALLFIIQPDARWSLRVGIFTVMVWLGAQSALTFSRGGMFCAIVSAAVALVFYVKEPRALLAPLTTAAAVVLVVYFAIWPRLDAFTGGNLSMRFQETDTSLRADLTAADLETFQQHVLLGVGPGLSKEEHLDEIISHTEFTRLLAEHGMFGVLAIGLLLVAVVRNVFRAPSGREKAIAAALMTWAFLFMSNSAMRLVAPSFTFGLAFCAVAAREAAHRAIAVDEAEPDSSHVPHGLIART